MEDKAPLHGRLGLLCALGVTLAVLATRPFLQMGVNDDFSYTQIALKLAETGKLLYNGWNTPMIGVQAYWAALLIKLFGFSFNTVRLSTLPSVAGCSWLLYYLARKAGASPLLASFAACFVMLSPLTIPLGASFMTDIPALFFLLVSIAVTLRAAQAATTAQLSFWLLLLGCAGVAGGTVRQIVWLAPIFFFPLLAIRRRSSAEHMLIAFFWAVTLAAIFRLSAWFSSQPYSVSLSFIPKERAGGRAIIADSVGMYLECSILFLPVLCLYAGCFAKLARKTQILIAGISILAAAVLMALAQYQASSTLLPFDYFAGNIVTGQGILASNVEAIGNKPTLLPMLLQALLMAAALALQLVTAYAVLPTVRAAFAGAKSSVQWTIDLLRVTDTVGMLNRILLIFTIPYLGTVFSRAILAQAIDRYLAPIMAVGVLLLLSARLIDFRPAVKLAAILLALFAGYGVATTHDYFSCSRARLLAANALTENKIDGEQITAGLEFDGWTQLATAGYINDPRITIPAKAFVNQSGRKYPLPRPYWFWAFTPALAPKYFVVLAPQPQLAATAFPPVPYSTWLPPYHRHVYVQIAHENAALAALRPAKNRTPPHP